MPRSSTNNSRRSSARVSSRNRFNYQAATKTLGPISHFIMLAMLLSVLGLIFLTQVTKTSSFGYEADQLSRNRDELIQKNQALKVEAARLQSIERISNSDTAKALKTPTEVEFLTTDN